MRFASQRMGSLSARDRAALADQHDELRRMAKELTRVALVDEPRSDDEQQPTRG